MEESTTPKRKYRALKKREKWSNEEHRRFLEALEMYGRDWMKITQHVESKSRVQVRSHAQKHFLKMEKMQRQSGKIPAPPGSPATPLIGQRNVAMDSMQFCETEMVTPELLQVEQLRGSYEQSSTSADPDNSSCRMMTSILESAESKVSYQDFPQGLGLGDQNSSVSQLLQRHTTAPERISQCHLSLSLQTAGVSHAGG